MLLASAVGILAASYYYHQPRNFPLGMGVSAQLGQTVLYGGLVLVFAGFAWLWPVAGGIIAILLSLLQMWQFLSVRDIAIPLTLIPDPTLYTLYSIYIAGGILSLIVGLRRKEASYTLTITDKGLQRAARITAFASIIIFVIAYIFIYPPLIFGAIPALFIVAIAWFWPAPGGVLMLLISVPDFYPLYNVGWDIQWKWPICVLLLVFIGSGLLHLTVAWRIRKRRSG
jgi:hypothetical protein